MNILPSHQLDSTQGLKKFLVLAAILHISAFLLLLILSNFSWGPLLSKSSSYQIVGPSLRVDVVAMPKMTIQEKAVMEAPSEAPVKEEKGAEPAPPKENEENVFKESGARESFLNKLKKLGQKQKGQETGKALPSDEIKKLIFEGNKISKGTSLQGAFTGENADDFNLFGQHIVERVRPYWKLPSYLKEKPLSNQVQIFLASSGQIMRINLYKSSGVEAYDQRAVEAVRSAAPFDPPPASVAQKMLEDGVILAFPL